MADGNVQGKKPEAKVRKSGDIVTVRNNSDRTLNLSKGRIESGKTGEVTVAELVCFEKFLEEVK